MKGAESRSISLISTVLNESASISNFLNSISHLDRTPDEIIIVDGGSTDGTWQHLNSWSESQPTARVLQHIGNISVGRNEAIRQARGPFIAVTDSGTRLDRSWLRRLEEKASPDCIVGGFCSPAGASRFEVALGALLLPRVEEVREDRFLPWSRSLLMPKAAWEQVGGYPEWLDYCEDLVLDVSMIEKGYAVRFAPQSMVTWNARSSLWAYIKQYFRYGRGDGKALLWTRRHTLRYMTYGIGSVTVLALKRRAALVAVPLGALYFQRYWRRLLSRRSQLGPVLMIALPLAPLMVVIGDLAKMAGYPVGRLWRRQQRIGR